MTNRSSVFLACLLLISPFAVLWADPTGAIEVLITPQVVENDHSVSWKQPLSKETQPGKPVVVNIDADPLAIKVSVTPFVRGQDFLLVVQGDVKQVGQGGTRGTSTLQSLMVHPGESIAYFPLGREPGPTGRQMVVIMQVEFKGD